MDDCSVDGTAAADVIPNICVINNHSIPTVDNTATDAAHFFQRTCHRGSCGTQ